MKSRILLTVLLSGIFSYASGEYSVTISPGTLEESLKDMPEGERLLRVGGSASIDDLLLLRDIDGVETLDIGGLKIEGGILERGDYYGRTVFAPDELPSYLFAGARYNRILLPGSVHTIGEGVFSGSSLEEVEIPSSVRRIGAYAFSSMPRLISVKGGEGVENIGRGVFENDASATDIDISQMRIRIIPERAFSGCASLSGLTVPVSVERIERYAFAGSGISSLDVRAASEIDDYAFSGMEELTRVALSAESRQGEGMFFGDGSLSGASGVSAEVPPLTFVGCKSMDVNDILVYAESLGDGALAATVTQKLVLGESVKRIEGNVFNGMTGLEEIDARALGGSVPAVNSETFAGLEQRAVILTVMADDYDVWRDSSYWNEFEIKKFETDGFADISGDSGIEMRLKDGVLTIVSDESIERVELYGVDGRVERVITPRREAVDVDMREHTGSQGFVVRAVTSTGERVMKILL